MSSWPVAAAWSPRRGSPRTSKRPGSTGLPPCAPRQSRRCLTAAHCRCRCLMTAIWPASPLPSSRASGSSSAATALSPPSAPASARICLPPPSATSPALPPPLPASTGRCAAKLKSASRSAPCSTSTRWPSTSPSTLPTPASASRERPPKSPWRRCSTASTSCAPACPPPLSTTPPQCAATKSLSLVERAFRCIKTVDLQIRPVYHWLADRVRAHVFLCMLAYYLEWHMRQRLAPMLYDDTDKDAAEAQRSSIVAKAERSPAAVTKQTTGRTEDGLPVHSFRTLLNDLATLTRNTLVTAIAPEQPFPWTARPTSTQQKARDLLGLSRTQ